MKEPLVSIIMPFFNTAPYIRRSIQSLQEQSYSNWELIAVDDASTDTSLSVVKTIEDSRIRVVSNPKNGGIGSAINLGLTFITGEYIAIMDSDDVVHSDRLAIEVEYLEKNPQLIMTGSEHMIVFQDDQEIDNIIVEKRKYTEYTPELDAIKRTMMLFNCPYKHPTVMIRRSMWIDLRYSELRYAEDYEMWTRAASCGKFGTIDLPLGYYRMHSGQNTRIATNKIELMKEFIWKPMFINLGMQLDSSELEMHAVLSLAHRPLKKEELPQLIQWLFRILDRFKSDQNYHSKSLYSILTNKLFELSRESAHLGLPVYKMFSLWIRRTAVYFSIIQRYKLLLKVILKQ